MKLAIFSESFRPLVNGVAYSVQSFARQLTEMGHEVHVFAPHYPNYEEPEDFPVHRYPGILTTLEQGYNIAVPFWPPMLKIMRDNRFQLIHTQSPFILGVSGARWARWLRIPLVTTHHTLYTEYVHYASPLPPGLSKVSVQAWTRTYCNRADRVIVPTEPIREVLQEMGIRRPVSVASTGVNIEAVREADPAGVREEYGIAPDAEVVVFVGRLAKEKNLDVLMKAFHRIAGERPQAVLLLVGGGQEEEPLKAQAQKLGLEDRIRFTGWQSPAERNRKLRAGDLFLYPSVSDTQGLVLCEALAAGLPCVAADAFGSKAVIRHGTDGLLVRATSVALYRGAMELLADPERRRRMAKAAWVGAERFSERAATERLLAIYDEVVERGPHFRTMFLHSLAGAGKQ